jgi:hypothetical protein
MNPSYSPNQIKFVSSFNELVSTPFNGNFNAICWKRELNGDFAEIANKLQLKENITVIDSKELKELQLCEQGNLAREILLNDYKLLKDYGAYPILNLIKCYEEDDLYSFFPTDVYSFHVDSSPVPTDTFLCTYYGESSDILPNSQAIQKILIPEIRNELKKNYHGTDENFEKYLCEHFFNLHYQPKHNAQPISLGQFNLWKLAVDCPESKVPPCIHRAPKEKNGQNRLLLIC